MVAMVMPRGRYRRWRVIYQDDNRERLHRVTRRRMDLVRLMDFE